MSCCPPGSAPYLAADHTDEGSVRSIDGISFYQVGSGERGVLVCPDIWGWNGGRTRAIADDFAKRGLSVWVPKLLPAYQGGTDGDALAPDFNVVERGSELGPLVAGDWNPEKVVPKVLKVVEAMKNAGIKKWGIVGVCYGAWIGMRTAKGAKLPGLVGGVAPHPSVHMEGMVGGDPSTLAGEQPCPWALFPCGEVGGAGADPEIYDPDGDVYKALEKKHKGKNVTKRFSKFNHGFVTRGNIKEKEFNAGRGDDVKAAVEECCNDMLEFFVTQGLTSRSRARLPVPPPKVKQPKFGQVSKLNPESEFLNLKLKVVSCTEVEGAAAKMWDAVLGDESGIVTFSLKSQDHADLCKPGNSVRVQNARVLMVKGFVRVIVDKWAVMKPSDETFEWSPNNEKDVSATEYEMVS